MVSFSDAVIAILITVMVLQLTVPRGPSLSALRPLLPVLFSYLLSFVTLAIFWNNHHHLLQAAEHISGTILWFNMLLLFWLSLLPFATAWVGQYPRSSWPAAVYGLVIIFASFAYQFLTRALIALHGQDSLLATALGSDLKGKVSITIYIIAAAAAFILPWISYTLYALVALWWLVPNRRIEKTIINGK